jgi:uncharacterized protein involved in exopolysaccharide biosynthesis
MSLGGTIAGTMRALLLAAATGGAAFGLLVVFHPFATNPASVVVGTPAADALHQRIDTARDALRQTETRIAALSGQPSAAPSSDAGQLEAQIAATTDRRDLAQRHAKAIRDALKANGDVSALAEIRDSVVVGQFLSQLSALDAAIAEQGARLKPNHPTMRGLAAQRTALLAQIKAEAANIAAALDSEARLDDAQLKQLQSQRTETPAPVGDGNSLAILEAQATAQRAELDALMDSYFGLPPSVAPRGDPILGALSPLNLLVAAIAAVAALAASIGLAVRRRRLRREAELAKWDRDHDPEIAAAVAAAITPLTAPALRRAS